MVGFTRLALLFSLVLPSAWAQGSRRISIQSNKDKFTLQLTGKTGSVDGKPANLTAFFEVLPVITKPLEIECGDLQGQPDITVEENGQKRFIYNKQGMVSDSKNCMSVTGDGLYYFPIHREFLIGPKNGSMDIKSTLKIFRQGVKVVSLKRNASGWSNEQPDRLLEFDFVDRFVNSLKDYEIRLRVQDGIATGKPKVLVEIDGKSYEFFKLTNVMWAVKRPGMKWLEASDDWSAWGDLEDKQMLDRHGEAIQQIANKAEGDEARLTALQRLENSWSPNIRTLLHNLLKDTEESEQMHALAIKYLKRKPSHETAGVLIDFIDKSHHEDLRKDAALALKVYNPKGPKLDTSSSAEEQAKVISSWRAWWASANKP